MGAIYSRHPLSGKLMRRGLAFETPAILDPVELPLPTMTEYAFSTLSYNPAETLALSKAFNRVPTEHSRVNMPAGTWYVPDNVDVNNYSVYAPKIDAINGAGIDKTIIRETEHSFTYLAARPASPGPNFYRMSRNGGAGQWPTSLSNMTFVGTEQLGADGLPMYRQGIINYFGRDAVWKDIKLVNMSHGGGNSPNTGETFAINMYRDVNSKFYRVEVDGRNEAGVMTGGSPLGCNNSTNVYLQDCYFHHSLFSGLTFSVAGSVQKPITTPTDTVTTLRVKVEQNANHPNVGSGSRFSGANHEHVVGKVTHTAFDVTLDQANLWDSNHLSIYNLNGDNPDYFLDSWDWHDLSPAWANKALTVRLSGEQVTPPKVKSRLDGSMLQPVIQMGNPGASSNYPSINPRTQYACLVDTNYVAP